MVDAPPITSGLFEVDPDGGLRLLGGRSRSSGLRHFPRSPVCPYTGADDVDDEALPRGGRLLWWTVVQTAPPGYEGPVPYGLAVISLDGSPELRVIGRIDAARPWSSGDRVHSVAEVIDTADGARTTWAFAAGDPT